LMRVGLVVFMTFSYFVFYSLYESDHDWLRKKSL
jgi:hypothetical protein